MNKNPPPRGGIGGLVLVFCLAAAITGLGFDFGQGVTSRFWIGAQPGAAAIIGGGAAAFCVLAAHLAKLVLGRKDAE